MMKIIILNYGIIKQGNIKNLNKILKLFNCDMGNQNKLTFHLSRIESPVYKDIRDSIFFYDTLSEINQFIFLSNIDDIDKLLTLTIQLYIPKESFIIYSDIITKNNIIYSKPLVINNHFVYETYGNITDELDRKRLCTKMELDAELYNKYDDDSFLSGNAGNLLGSIPS